MRRAALTTLLLGAVLRATAQISDPAQAAAIIAQLEDAPTSAARFNLLNGRDFVFDFNAGVGVAKGAGGNITIASLADFPFLVGKGMSLAVGKMAPCGLATPHYHPRAAEFLYMMSGSNLKVGFIQENGARFVTNLLNPGQGAIFPKGSFHYQANLDCEPVTFVSGLNSEDPGVATIAQRFFGIPPAVVDATLSDIGVDEVVRIAQSIPDTFAIGVQSCLDKCKITRGDQPKTQQQPRVGGNEFPGTTGNTNNNTSNNSSNNTSNNTNNNTTNSGHDDSQKPPPDHNNGKPPSDDDKSDNDGDDDDDDWDSDEWNNKNTRQNGGVKDGAKSEAFDWRRHQKRSDVAEDPISAISSLMSSTNAQTLEELAFFLKLVLGVLLSGYVFVWAYFIVPAWKNRRVQAELQARAAVPPSVPVQDVKA